MANVPIPPIDDVAVSAVKPVRLSPAVWALGLTSLFMDISSEMIHSLLAGIHWSSVSARPPPTWAPSKALPRPPRASSRYFSGALSDYFGRRKPLALWVMGWRH